MGGKIRITPDGDKWKVKKDGTSKASAITDTQGEAIQKGVQQAKREGAELVIHDQKGRIRDADSYGKDPHPPKDKKH